MRILMINHHRTSRSWHRAGIFAERLVARGHRVTLLVVADRAHFRFARRGVNGVDLVECPDLTFGKLRSGWDFVCALRRWRWLVRENARYDVIHLFETRPATIYPGLAWKRKTGAPLVIDWIDWWGRGGLISVNRPWWYRLLFAGVETYYEEHFRRRADATTVMSRGLARRARALGIRLETILQIRNGADLERFVPREKAEARARLGLPGAAFLVGFASMDTFIDLAPFLDGFAFFARQAPGARLVMIGRVTPGARRLARRAGLASRTDFPGFVSEADYPLYLSACDALAMPFPETNYNIGRWPNKFGEYLASARPVLFNPAGDLAEFAEGEPPGIPCAFSASSFADGLARLHADPALAERLGRRARALALERLDWSKEIDKLERLYARLAGEGQRDGQ